MVSRKHWKKLSILLAIGLGVIVCSYLHFGKKEESTQLWSDNFHYDVWPPFLILSNYSRTWLQNACLSFKTEFSVSNLKSILSSLQKSPDLNCSLFFKKAHALYHVEKRDHSSLLLPRPLQEKVRKWLGNKESLYNEIYDQEVIHIVNHYTREHTIFNPLRDKRPVQPLDQPESLYFSKLLNETQMECDFCNYKDGKTKAIKLKLYPDLRVDYVASQFLCPLGFTAEHTFHRVESTYAFSASNVFKMDPLHALFALKQHDPLHWSKEQFIDLMHLTLSWYRKAHSAFPEAQYPSLIWDVLPKCGASQVHPHLHGFLDSRQYHGVVEAWRMAAEDYYVHRRTNFYTDMAAVASGLGLAITYKSAIAFASLVPRKDHEIVIMSSTAGTDFFELIYFVLRAVIDDLGKFCYSMGLAYPAMDDKKAQIPAYARIITRGAVTEIRADISSLELFTATNVNIDPFKVIRFVKNSVLKRS